MTTMSLAIISSFHCKMPSPLVSATCSFPVSTHDLVHPGSSVILLPATFVIKMKRENAAYAGAVKYNNAINKSAQAPDQRAAFIVDTVKKRTITWGSPAVPAIKVNIRARNCHFVPLVNGAKYSDIPSSRSSSPIFPTKSP